MILKVSVRKRHLCNPHVSWTAAFFWRCRAVTARTMKKAANPWALGLLHILSPLGGGGVYQRIGVRLLTDCKLLLMVNE